MASPLMLEGNVDHDSSELSFLRSEVARLEGELREARREGARAKHDAEKIIRALQKQLSPFYNLLRALFGEIEAIAPGESESTSTVDPRWESWKKRMPGKPAEFIDLLLIHGSMSIKQFQAATRCGQNTAYQTVSKLGQAGVTVNNSGRYSLKQ